MNKESKQEDSVSESKIIHTKSYTIRIDTFENGKFGITRTNDGFHALELLGLLERIQFDILEQMNGNIKPDFVNRNVVINPEN